MDQEVYQKVVDKLIWMQAEQIWPNGTRYLWTDAHGVIALVSLYKATNDESYLEKAEAVVREVYKTLGRPRGLRIGEDLDRDGQYFHYLTKWMFALNQLGRIKPMYHEEAVKLVKDVHEAFVIRGRGVRWKMTEDLSATYPGYGLGGLDHYDGYVQYRLLDPVALSSEINDMKLLIDADYKKFSCTQDLALGESLWTSHFFPDEPWAQILRQRSIKALDSLWCEKGSRGYFCREPKQHNVKFAFTNFGISYALQAVKLWPQRVQKLNTFFEEYRSNDEYDQEAITHVMHVNSLFPGLLAPYN